VAGGALSRPVGVTAVLFYGGCGCGWRGYDGSPATGDGAHQHHADDRDLRLRRDVDQARSAARRGGRPPQPLRSGGQAKKRRPWAGLRRCRRAEQPGRWPDERGRFEVVGPGGETWRPPRARRCTRATDKEACGQEDRGEASAHQEGGGEEGCGQARAEARPFADRRRRHGQDTPCKCLSAPEDLLASSSDGTGRLAVSVWSMVASREGLSWIDRTLERTGAVRQWRVPPCPQL
jgi:hypothetical protein